MGGEKSGIPAAITLAQGSPPRGRGKGRLSILSSIATGITPAWAGKRYGCDRGAQSQKDHPRVGGEK